jgi:hypothetical protein
MTDVHIRGLVVTILVLKALGIRRGDLDPQGLVVTILVLKVTWSGSSPSLNTV